MPGGSAGEEEEGRSWRHECHSEGRAGGGGGGVEALSSGGCIEGEGKGREAQSRGGRAFCRRTPISCPNPGPPSPPLTHPAISFVIASRQSPPGRSPHIHPPLLPIRVLKVVKLSTSSEDRKASVIVELADNPAVRGQSGGGLCGAGG